MTSVNDCSNDCGQCNDECEIERLRALITAWADAEDANKGAPLEEMPADSYFHARDALRKAVER